VAIKGFEVLEANNKTFEILRICSDSQESLRAFFANRKLLISLGMLQ
jgi:hypothetical protein